MKVFLNIRYGSHMPSKTEAVELEDEVAKMLIENGNATEAKKAPVNNADKAIAKLEAEVKSGKETIARLEDIVIEAIGSAKDKVPAGWEEYNKGK